MVIVNKQAGSRESKNEGIPSKSNLENSIHFYFSILGTKQIAIDCQNRYWKCFRSREDVLEKSWG